MNQKFLTIVLTLAFLTAPAAAQSPRCHIRTDVDSVVEATGDQ
jgi:hypothetical protein